MNAPGGPWERNAPFCGVSFNDKQTSMTPVQTQPSITQVFLVALNYAIGDCVKKGAGAYDLANIDMLEALKSIARTMHYRSDDYANWLEAKVRDFASKHPNFSEEFSADKLRSIFSPLMFDTECKHASWKAPQPLQSTSACFVSAHVVQLPQPRIAPQCVSPPAETRGYTGRLSGQTTTPPNAHLSYVARNAGYAGPITPTTTRKTPFVTHPGAQGASRGSSAYFKELSPPGPRPWGNQLSARTDQQPTPLRHGRSSFRPSRELVGQLHIPSPARLIQAQQAGVKRNPQYHGDLTDLDIANASCPPELNCAVRIENISRYATYAEIFDLIIEGKVFSFSKKDPIPGCFPNCAARLVFTTREAAAAFVARGQSWEGIVLHGHRFSVKWNRDACRPVRHGERHQSRVIRVMGPEKELCVEGVEKLFHTHIKFNLVDSRDWLVEGDKRIVELSFCSILGQSRIAYKFFHEYMEAWGLNGCFSIGFGPDPCEPIVGLFSPPFNVLECSTRY